MPLEEQDSEVSRLIKNIGKLSLQDSNKNPLEDKHENFRKRIRAKTKFISEQIQELVPPENEPLELSQKENLEEPPESSGGLSSFHETRSSGSDQEEESSRGHNEPIFAELKNENCHLKLELTQRAQEIEQLQMKLQNVVKTSKFHPLRVPEIHTAREPESKFTGSNSSPTRLSCGNMSDFDIVTHFSSSPYKGRTISPHQTPDSTPSTDIGKLRNNHKLFRCSIVPYIGKTIDAFQCSEVFGEDAKETGEKFEEFSSLTKPKEQKIQLMAEILDDLVYLQRQCIALLNRELQVKKISSQLEFLLTVFLDPEQYGLMKQDHVSRLKEEMMNVLINLFDYDVDSGKPHTTESSSHDLLRQLKKRDKTDPFYKVKKVQKLQMGLDICTDALHNYSLRNFDVATKSETQTTHKEPSMRGLAERRRLRENKDSLEFIPIGYDEAMLAKKTPHKVAKEDIKHDGKIKWTPILDAVDCRRDTENDPLQIFFSEFLEDATSQDDSKTTITSISDF